MKSSSATWSSSPGRAARPGLGDGAPPCGRRTKPEVCSQPVVHDPSRPGLPLDAALQDPTRDAHGKLVGFSNIAWDGTRHPCGRSPGAPTMTVIAVAAPAARR